MRFGILGPRVTIVTLGVTLGLLARLVIGPPAPVEPNQRRFLNPEPSLPTWTLAPSVPPIRVFPFEDAPPADLPEDWYLDLPLSRPGEKANEDKRP